MAQSSRNLNPEDRQNRQSQSLSTNQVIRIEERDEVIYYLPCYVRFLVKQIQNVDVTALQGTMTGTLLFSFYYGKVEKLFIEEFTQKDKESAILLQFNQEESILLKEDKGVTMRQDQNERIINFIVRKTFKTNLQGNVFLTPFETLDMCLSVIVQTVSIPIKEETKKIKFKFNCMNSDEVDLLGHGSNLSFGYYRIANYHLDAKYSNNRKNPYTINSCFGDGQENEDDIGHSHKKDDRIQCFQYAHFRIPIYKYPGMSILTVFVPIWILGFISLMVFFQQSAFSGRLSTIATLSLAFVAFLPTINSSVPQTPNLKLVDILIFMQLAALILLIIQSFDSRLASTSEFDWENNRLFLGALALNCATFLIVLILFIVHKICWEPGYKKKKQVAGKVSKNLMRSLWKNEECNFEFSKFTSKYKMKNL